MTQGNIGGSPLQYVLGVYNGTRDGTSAPDAGDADALLAEALKTMKAAGAAKHVAQLTGLDRKDLYARALEMKAK